MATQQPARLTIQRPWWAVGKTQWGGTPFGTLGMDYCMWCKMEVDTNTEAHHDGGTYVYRRDCRRCGRVVASGAVEVPTISGGVALPEKALVWLHDVKRDQR